MLATKAVEIGSGNPVQCSRRLLSAIRGGNLQSVKRELARAAHVSETHLPRHAQSALVEEQKELLGAIIERINTSISGYEPSVGAELFLLGHLAGTWPDGLGPICQALNSCPILPMATRSGVDPAAA